MRCGSCGRFLPDEAFFCFYCGSSTNKIPHTEIESLRQRSRGRTSFNTGDSAISTKFRYETLFIGIGIFFISFASCWGIGALLLLLILLLGESPTLPSLVVFSILGVIFAWIGWPFLWKTTLITETKREGWTGISRFAGGIIASGMFLLGILMLLVGLAHYSLDHPVPSLLALIFGGYFLVLLFFGGYHLILPKKSKLTGQILKGLYLMLFVGLLGGCVVILTLCQFSIESSKIHDLKMWLGSSHSLRLPAFLANSGRLLLIFTIIYLICIFLLIYTSKSQLNQKKPLYRSTMLNDIAQSPLIQTLELFALSFPVAFIIVLVTGASGEIEGSLGTLGFQYYYPAWKLTKLGWAGIGEELSFRVFLIGVPLVLWSAAMQFYSSRSLNYFKIKNAIKLLRGKVDRVGPIELFFLLLSSIIFGAAHVQYGWGSWKFYEAGIAGIIYGWAYLRFGIESPIFLHYCNNMLIGVALLRERYEFHENLTIEILSLTSFAIIVTFLLLGCYVGLRTAYTFGQKLWTLKSKKHGS